MTSLQLMVDVLQYEEGLIKITNECDSMLCKIADWDEEPYIKEADLCLPCRAKLSKLEESLGLE